MAGKNQNSEKKSIRILKIIKRLYQKEILNGNDLANEFNIDIKTKRYRNIESLFFGRKWSRNKVFQI